MTPTKTGNVLSWATDIDPNALEQAERTARLPFMAGHLALMPDAHWGMGATIGSVIPTKGAIIPAAVGVDIGCGMIAAELPFTADLLPDDLDRLHGYIAKVIPAGVGRGHEHEQRIDSLRNAAKNAGPYLTDKQWTKAASQMGTLGAGNHFVEVCLDERGRVWLVLHSGSRGIGNQLAQVHIDGAKGDMKRRFIELEDPDLAWLVEKTPEFDAYITAMLWAQDYALANRETMMDALLAQVAGFIGRDFEPSRRINCHHNFCEMEHHCFECTNSQDSGSRSPASPSAGDLLAKVRGSLGGCRPLLHSCGGLLLRASGGDLVPAPLRVDVLERTDSFLAADLPVLESSRSRSGGLVHCACASPSGTDVSPSNFSSMFGRDFSRLFAEGTPSRTQDRLLERALYGEEPSPQSSLCEHKGSDVWLTRKGAIRARNGDMGVIPGSMGTASYIVRGKGNPASYNSCSHGAGRRMSRGQARRELDIGGLQTAMRGKAWNERDAKTLLDEDPRAYKDIDRVMADQADLVEVEHTLTQILNYKGT